MKDENTGRKIIVIGPTKLNQDLFNRMMKRLYTDQILDVVKQVSELRTLKHL